MMVDVPGRHEEGLVRRGQKIGIFWAGLKLRYAHSTSSTFWRIIYAVCFRQRRAKFSFQYGKEVSRGG
jgi:hypothetical protein